MLSANAVMLGHHFIPLELLQHGLSLSLNAAWHSSQLVYTLCIKQQLLPQCTRIPPELSYALQKCFQTTVH